MIEFVFEGIETFEISFNSIKKWLDDTISSELKIGGDITVVFCSDTYLLEINKKYLNHNYFTDVITFDYSEDNIVSGDILISIDRIADNAKQFNVSFDNELLRIIIHGVLHLIGYNDKTKKDKILMTSKEDEYLLKYYDVEGV